MQLKIWGSHFRSKVAIKCLNVQRGNKEFPLPFPVIMWIISVNERIKENLDFVENSNFIRGSTAAVFVSVQLKFHREKPKSFSKAIWC